MHVEGNFDVDMQTLADAFDGGDRAYDQGFWAQRDMAGAIARIPPNGVAVLAYNSWFDIWQRGDSLVYSILQNAAARRQPFAPMTPHQRVSPRYQVVLGPYVHAESGSLIPALLGELSLEWFDTWLKHERTGIAGTRTPLHAYELHGGRWTDTTTWPPPSVRPLTLYFDHGPSASGAASLNDGALAPTHPSDRSSDQIWWNGELNSPCTRQLYQQSNAILLVTPTVDNPCFYDDRSFELGALTYTTSPFTRAIDVAGPGDVTVYATANTPNTEWVATLSDVAPDGSARPLTTGDLIGSLRALDPSRSWTRGGRLLMPWHPFTRASETPVIPGALTRYDIELPGILTRVQPGHRLRLTLQTSDAPYLAPTLPDQDQLLGGRYAVSRGGTFASELTLATLAPRNLRRGSPSWGPCRLDC
jgi:uncharacterized protein